jgi:hypothetical protein
MSMPFDEAGESNGSGRIISIPNPIAIRDLADALEVPPHSVIAAALAEFNMFATLNTQLDFTSASALCSRYGVVAREVI